MSVKKNLELFWWFLKFGLIMPRDEYNTHDHIRGHFCPKYIPARDFDEKEQLLRDTPGPSGIKYAYYVGSMVSGVFGAALAIAALLIPVIAITVGFLYVYEPIMSIQMFNVFLGEKIFNGMHATALGLIIAHLYKIIYFNQVRRKALVFVLPSALLFIFLTDAAGQNNAALMPIYLVAIVVFGVISGFLHTKAVAYRKKHPKQYDPYSKKAIKLRDRQLREEEWDMRGFIDDDTVKRRREQVEEERIDGVKDDKMNRISDGKE